MFEFYASYFLFLCSYSGFAETYIGRTIKSIANSFNTKFELQQVKY